MDVMHYLMVRLDVDHPASPAALAKALGMLTSFILGALSDLFPFCIGRCFRPLDDQDNVIYVQEEFF